MDGKHVSAGSEEDVGIEYQVSETAPETNGLYKVTRDGLFRLTLSGYWGVTGLSFPTAVNQDIVTTGPASAGTAHDHPVQQTGLDAYILGSGPELFIDLWKKPVAGAIAIAKDENNRFFRWTNEQSPMSATRTVTVAAQWNVNLLENEKLSIKFTGATMARHRWHKNGDPLKLRFEWIGSAAPWSIRSSWT